MEKFNSNKAKKTVNQEAKKQIKSKFIDITKMNTTAKKIETKVDKNDKDKDRDKLKI